MPTQMCTNHAHQGEPKPAAKGRGGDCRSCYDREWRLKHRQAPATPRTRAITGTARVATTTGDLASLGLVELAQRMVELESGVAQVAAEMRSRLERRTAAVG